MKTRPGLAHLENSQEAWLVSHVTSLFLKDNYCLRLFNKIWIVQIEKKIVETF